MKVDLSKEEYRVLVEIFSLAGMVLDAYGRGNVPERNRFTNWNRRSTLVATILDRAI